MSQPTVFNPETIDWISVSELDHHGILYVLPHRYPFLLVDRVLEIKPGKKLNKNMSMDEIDDAKVGSFVRARKNVTFNEVQFQGHFPENPLLPGVLTLEAMAQSAAFSVVPFIAAMNKGKFKSFGVALAGFDSVRFRKPIRPGDTLEMQMTLKNYRKSLYSFTGVTLVDGKSVAEAELLAQLIL